MGKSAVLFHTTLFAVYNFAIYYHSLIPNNPEHPPASNYVAKFKYFTYWNLIFQATAFGLCLACDLLHDQVGWGPKLVKLKDRFFTSIAVPFGLYVFSTFWALYFYDRELIFPKKIEKFYPYWLNHLVHTFIILPILVEMKLFKHEQPTKNQGLKVVWAIGLVYGAWVIFLALYFKLWVYPFLALLGWTGRILFFLASCLLTTGFYLVGECLNRLFWPVQEKERRKKP